MSRRGQETLSIQMLLQTLEQVSNRFAQVSVVLDALDECTQMQVLLDTLTITLTKRSSHIRWVMTSRRHAEILSTFQDLKIPIVALEDIVVDSDIRLHVRACLNKDPRIRKWGEYLTREIEDELTQRADGM